MKSLLITGLAAVVLFTASQAQAQPVGELHRVTSDDTARLRNADHSTNLRITVWYPAATDSTETPLLVGPPDQPLFDIGRVAPDAPFATSTSPHPVILLSHGFGGSARIMGWFGIAMARNGFIVIAVDHPGNNAIDKMTLAGAVLWWDRADDLRIALQAMKNDPAVSPHLDATRIAATGFSAGGFTALVLAGARVDRRHFQQFCATHPTDGGCVPPREFPIARQDVDRLFQAPEMQAEATHAGEDHSISGLRAVFVIAPALVQALDPASLTTMRNPNQHHPRRCRYHGTPCDQRPGRGGSHSRRPIAKPSRSRALRFPRHLHRGRPSAVPVLRLSGSTGPDP